MSIAIESTTTADLEELADSQAVLDHLVRRTPLDPAVYRRVRERAAKITEALQRKHGTLNIAVDLIRQTRDEG